MSNKDFFGETRDLPKAERTAGSLAAAAMDMEDFTAGVVDILEATLLIRMKPLVGRRRGETSSRRRTT